jgi:uncharacterized protein (DUF58 family)
MRRTPEVGGGDISVEGQIFDAAFLRKLEIMTLQAKKALAGKNSGDRRSPLKGKSVEFADFRNYAIGDDFRQIDWNAYARLEKLFLKLFLEEQDATVYLYLDCSTSMDQGQPPKGKMARQLAAALAYISLANFDRVAVGACTDRLAAFLPPVRGRGAVWQVWNFIDKLPSAGMTDLNGALREVGRYRPNPGISIVISDLLSPAGCREGLKYLRFHKQEVSLLQVLSPEELNPGLRGDLRLIDCESGAAREVTVTPALLQAYRQRLARLVNETRGFCLRQGINYLQVSSDASLDTVLLRSMREAGILGN